MHRRVSGQCLGSVRAVSGECPGSGGFPYRRSEGFALTGYVVPGCVEDGTWMLWENSSVVVAVVVAVLARYFLDNFSKQSSFLVIFHQKLTFCVILFLKAVFSPKNFRRRHACPHFSAFILEKIQVGFAQSAALKKLASSRRLP